MKEKILIVTNMYPSDKYPHYGVFVKNTADILMEEGYEIDVVSLKKHTTFLTKLFSYLVFYIKTIFYIIFKKYDVVYAHYVSHTALPILIAKSIKTSIRIVSNVHGNDIVEETPHDKKYFKYSRRLLEISEYVIAPSEYFKNILIKIYNVGNEKICIYPSGGVNTEIFKKMDRDEALNHCRLDKKFKYFGYVSRIEHNKGWDILLKAFSQIKDEIQEVKLIVVGDGDEIEDYNRMVNELGLKEDIIKYSLLSQRELSYVFNCLDVFVFPTRRESESLGLVGLEAMACGCLTLLSNKYGPSNYGKEGVNAFLFDPKNENALAKKLLYCSNRKFDEITSNAISTANSYSIIETRRILINFFNDFFCQ